MLSWDEHEFFITSGPSAAVTRAVYINSGDSKQQETPDKLTGCFQTFRDGLKPPESW